VFRVTCGENSRGEQKHHHEEQGKRRYKILISFSNSYFRFIK
jgi:hypothetical protein